MEAGGRDQSHPPSHYTLHVSHTADELQSLNRHSGQYNLLLQYSIMKYCRGFYSLENFPAYMDFRECCMERNTHKWDGKNAASAVGRPRCWISRRSSVKSFGMAQGVRCHWHRSPIARELWVFWQAARYRRQQQRGVGGVRSLSRCSTARAGMQSL